MLFGCPTANFGPMSRGQPHSHHVNYCIHQHISRMVCCETFEFRPDRGFTSRNILVAILITLKGLVSRPRLLCIILSFCINAP